MNKDQLKIMITNLIKQLWKRIHDKFTGEVIIRFRDGKPVSLSKHETFSIKEGSLEG